MTVAAPRIAVVTGAAAGIGRATALALAESGWAVAIVDRDLRRAEAVAAELTTSGAVGVAFETDIADLAAVAALAERVRRALGSPTTLVNCAGWDDIAPFLNSPATRWIQVLNVNLLGTIAVTHAFLPDLIAHAGRIVNVSSDAGRVGSAGETVYASAKAGIIGFTKSLAREMASCGVMVNCVAPGPVKTEFLEKNPENVRAAILRAIPMRRFGEPEEVARTIRFFADPETTYITGQVLSVSGGLTMVG